MTSGIGLLALLLSQNPAIDARVEHYDVTGSTAARIRSEMNRLRPTDDNGERYDAFTRWYVSWRYDYARGAPKTSNGRSSLGSLMIATEPSGA